MRTSIAEIRAFLDANAIRLDALRFHFGDSLFGKTIQHRGCVCRLCDSLIELLLAKCPNFSEAHAIGRQHTGKRMNKDTLHPQRIGHEASVLPPCPTKAIQRVACDIIAPLNANLLNGVCHVLNGNPQKAFGRFLWRQDRVASFVGDLLRERRELLSNDV